MWFEDHEGNAVFDNLADIKDTINQGGWYRANLVPGELTFLSFNSLVTNEQYEESGSQKADSAAQTEIDWFETQLKQAGPEEKFIIEMHIYETAGWWKKAIFNWNEDSHQKRFYGLMEQYRDIILLEVTGHDHLGGMRAHATTEDPNQYFLNKVLFPGLTATSNTQPGFSNFVYDSEKNTVEQLQFTFIDVDATIGKPITTTYDEFDWFNVNFTSKFGLQDLSAQSIASFVDRMSDDLYLAREYQFNRMGINTGNPKQLEKGLASYIDTRLIGQDATVDTAFLSKMDNIATECLMLRSMSRAELDWCVITGKAKIAREAGDLQVTFLQ